MTEASKFILKDVRCFEGHNEFEIRPLTFLVGENSTGKSTVLGCFQVLSDFLSSEGVNGLHFANTPCQMRDYSDIARKTRSLAGEFRIGMKFGDIQYTLTLREPSYSPEPAIKTVELALSDCVIIVKNEPLENNGDPPGERVLDSVRVQQENDNRFIVTVDSCVLDYHFPAGPAAVLEDIRAYTSDEKESLEKRNLRGYLNRYLQEKDSYGFPKHSRYRPRTYSFAPIRPEPERTYNPLDHRLLPGGNETPMTLLNMSTMKGREWKHLVEGLENFGKSSGLFASIDVKKSGRSFNDLFQLQVKVRGPKGNFVDAGFGISQVLPILVRILRKKNSRFLLQQPEAYLHPRGQAELASWLNAMKEENKNSFIVETHSDAMIDRARIEIMRGKLNPRDVSLVYLEPSGNKVDVHNISFDESANMIGVPGSYRQFFLKEQNQLLGFTD